MMRSHSQMDLYQMGIQDAHLGRVMTRSCGQIDLHQMGILDARPGTAMPHHVVR